MDRVQKNPDFSKQTIAWNILVKSAKKNVPGMEYYDQWLSTEVPLLPLCKAYSIEAFVEANQPKPWVSTLSDDQRFPVFVLGFRIGKRTAQPSSTPDKEASPP